MTILGANRVKNNTGQPQFESPRWIVLYGGHPENVQRRRWGGEMQCIVEELIGTGQWVMWCEGDEVHCRHRSQVTQ